MRVLYVSVFILAGLTLTSTKPVFPALPAIPMLELAKGGISTLMAISKMMPKQGGGSSEDGGGGLASILGLGKKPDSSDNKDDGPGGLLGGLAKMMPKPSNDEGGGLASLLGLGKKSGDDSAAAGGGSGGGGLSSLLGLDKNPLMNMFKHDKK